MGLSDRTLYLSKTFVGECAITLVDSPLQGDGHNLQSQNILFGGKYDLGICLLTKSVAVCLSHRYQIKLMERSTKKHNYLDL